MQLSSKLQAKEGKTALNMPRNFVHQRTKAAQKGVGYKKKKKITEKDSKNGGSSAEIENRVTNQMRKNTEQTIVVVPKRISLHKT